MKPLFLIGVAVCLFASGCDSKTPLSDPQASKGDERLVGVWRDRSDGDVYYHVGHAGEKFPACMMRVVGIKHSKGNVEPPFELLIFPTVLGDKTYLNAILGGDDKLVKSLDEKGWKAVEVDNYTLYRYKFDGDKLVVYGIDQEAKQKAIKSGKVKGIEENNSTKFTDTTENLARFVKEAGDSLWDMKTPGRLERVNVGKKSPSYMKIQGKLTYEDGTIIPTDHLIVIFIGQPPDPKIIPAHGLAVVDAKTGSFSLELRSADNAGLDRGNYKVFIQGANNLVTPMFTNADTTTLTVDIRHSLFEIKIPKPRR